MLGRQDRTEQCWADRTGQSSVGWIGQDVTVLSRQDRTEKCWVDKTGQGSVG